ncbi:MAG: ComEC/Rec2 family competence protein [Chitinophagaceae bacterium]
MARKFVIPVWRGLPAIRLLLPFALGIYLQWQYKLPPLPLWLCAAMSILLFFIFRLLAAATRYRWRAVAGCLLCTALFCTGALLTWYKNPLHHPLSIQKVYTGTETLELILETPAVQRPNSWKAQARMTRLIAHNKMQQAHGLLWIYFVRDSSFTGLPAGTLLLTRATPQPVTGTGNPGAFDYARYSLFNGITHQLYLQPGDYICIPGNYNTRFSQWLTRWRNWIIQTLEKYIPGKKEAGLAEALLIGYKDNLDRELVQSYTNTGIVHIIAISGLHLGLIYWLLQKACTVLPQRGRWRWLSPLLQITALWIFSLLAGAQASVLRSAVMFTILILGQSISRKHAIYNSLALAAFLLLCYQPYWLWDIGFQLSFLAVASLILFMQPIYQLIYLKWKAFDLIWKMCAVTLAAQLLTLPICLYQFHQFPNYFLIANLLIVPLSSLILIGEILLCLAALLPAAAAVAGTTLSWLIWLMNETVQYIERLPYALTRSIQLTAMEAAGLMLLLVLAAMAWLKRSRYYTWLTACSCIGLWGLLRYSQAERQRQQLFIVYNSPRAVVMDFVNGHRYTSWYDTTGAGSLSYYLDGSRALFNARPVPAIEGLKWRQQCIAWRGQRIWVVSRQSLQPADSIYPVDILVLASGADSSLQHRIPAGRLKQVIAASTLSNRVMEQWRRYCRLHSIAFHAVKTDGAFVMKQR